jgi:NDP-sugar pyrophosphorylase family protein
MKIIIPMAGIGQRFVNAGFKDIKPLIDIDGKPMVERICQMFPPDSEFIFICNKEHLETTPLREVLERSAKNKLILAINPHKKGPVFSCLAAFDHVDDSEEVFVNYCDLLNEWDFNDLLEKARKGNYEGVLPAFKGFHPASLGTTFYAYMRVNEKDELLEIREKEAFTDNRMNEFASAGGYYFSRGGLFKKYFRKVIDENHNVNDEYYASIPYNFMMQDGLKVLAYDLPKHIVLGTPSDYNSYMFWSDFFRKKANGMNGQLELNSDCTTLIPVAGRKKAFYENNDLPKPLIRVMKKPMFINTLESLPKTNELIAIFLDDFINNYNIDYVLTNEFPKSTVIKLNETTQGMACTCLRASNTFDPDKPLIISSSDFILEYNKEKLKETIDNQENDVIFFSHIDHDYVRRNPNAHTYLQLDEDNKFVVEVSEKVPISNKPFNDHAFAGAIFFRTGQLFIEAANKMIRREKRVNGEFLVATCVNELIESNKKVVPFVVDKFVSIGNLDNYKEFKYWEDYFDKLPYHPYSKTN